MSSIESLPVITLRPAGDARNKWTALLLDAEPVLDGSGLARILVELDLYEKLSGLTCVAFADPLSVDPALAAKLPGTRLILCFPAETALEEKNRDALAALQAAGFGLMAQGIAPPGRELFPGVKSLAMACPGFPMPAGLGDQLKHLPGPHLMLTSEEETCSGHCQFHWFAGYSVEHAAPAPKEAAGGRGLLLRLLALVTSDADNAEIEAAIKCDPNLSYNLLKLVNSVAFSSKSKITSFSQAITLLGRRQLQRWLQLLLYTRPKGSDVASPLLPRAALRARLMELLAQHAHLSRDQQDHAFMVGMFSLLEKLLGTPVAEIVQPLNLAESVVKALTRGEGELGSLLTAVVAGEGSPNAALKQALDAAGIDCEGWAHALIDATSWAVQIGKEA